MKTRKKLAIIMSIAMLLSYIPDIVLADFVFDTTENTIQTATILNNRGGSIRGYASWAKLNDNKGITVTAKQGGNPVGPTVETLTSGLFELPLANGSYEIVLSKPGYLQRTIPNVFISEGATTNLGSIDNPITLLAGDVNADKKVNAQDLSLLLAAFNKTNGVAGYLAAADFNGDNSINATDLSKLLENFNKTISDYPDWVESFTGGTGTINNPYLVSNADQLNNVRNYMSEGIYFKQTADIDLSTSYWTYDKGWEPIGNESKPFKGSYNGNGNKITGLYINRGG